MVYTQGMDSTKELITSIILRQSIIIGRLAYEEANKVPGLKVTTKGEVEEINGDPNQILELLVKRYASLFGRAAIQVCKNVVFETISQSERKQLPDILR